MPLRKQALRPSPFFIDNFLPTKNGFLAPTSTGISFERSEVMSKRRWEAPVLVACRRTGKTFIIATTEEALNTLLNAWPVSTGKAFLQALQTCADVDAGLRTPEEARDFFIAAAQEAYVPIEMATSGQPR